MNICIPLSELGLNQPAKVLNFVSEEVPMKLLEMGLLPETQIMVKAKAPFNGPIIVEYGIDKSRLALRKEEAKGILIEAL